MSTWPSTKAKRVLRALKRHGWTVNARGHKSGSHVQLVHPDFAHEYTWAWHDSDELGPKMLARIAKVTGLRPEDL